MFKHMIRISLTALTALIMISAQAKTNGDGICYSLSPVKDTPDFTHWLQDHDVEMQDMPVWKKQKVYSESVAQEYIRSGKRVFVFRPQKFRWYLYEGGSLIESGIANGGKRYCKDIGRGCRTPPAVFKVYRKGGGGCVSNKFPVESWKPRAKMPYCMFLAKQKTCRKKVAYKLWHTNSKGQKRYETKYRYEETKCFRPTGYAIHGSKYIHPRRHGSHGCIRVETPDARMLSNEYMRHGDYVVVTGYTF